MSRRYEVVAKFTFVSALLIGLSGFVTQPLAGTLTAQVNDSDGNAVANAVVFIVGGDTAPSSQPARMVQRDQMFVPHVLAVSTGTTVEFPNEDTFRHHVYSLFPAKNFELKLYGGDEIQQVVFDQPGVVAMGCNIHDNMLGYIYVVDSRLFGTIGADGTVTIEGLENGATYEAQVWHPRLRGPTRRTAQNVSSDSQAEFEIRLKRDRREQSGSDFEEGVY